MGVYYHKLWERLKSKNITQTYLMSQTKISSSTLSKLRNNEFVSIEIIDRICSMLDCDYSDIITRKPPEDQLHRKMVQLIESEKVHSLGRDVLSGFMSEKGLTVAQVAEITTLSVNTVKSYLNGNEISSRSYVKLMRLGEDYNRRVGLSFNELVRVLERNRTYCKVADGRKKDCWAAQSQWLPSEKKYEDYCAFGFVQDADENGNLYTCENCPHPTSAHKLEDAKQNFDYQVRGSMKIVQTDKVK